MFFINYHKVITSQCRTLNVLIRIVEYDMSSCSIEARQSNLLNLIYIQKETKNPKNETILKIILNGKLVFPSILHILCLEYLHPTFTIKSMCKRIRLSKIYGLLQNQNSFSALHMRKIFPFEFFFWQTDYFMRNGFEL